MWVCGKAQRSVGSESEERFLQWMRLHTQVSQVPLRGKKPCYESESSGTGLLEECSKVKWIKSQQEVSACHLPNGYGSIRNVLLQVLEV